MRSISGAPAGRRWGNILALGVMAAGVVFILFCLYQIGRFAWDAGEVERSAQHEECIADLEAVTHREVHWKIYSFCTDFLMGRHPDLDVWAQLSSGYIGPLAPQEFAAEWLTR